jgi:hypothetical protein
MIFLVLSLAVQAALIVHVIRTGRNQLWIWAIALLPAAGSLAYVIVEVLPDLFGSRGARRASRQVQRLIDPDRELREARAAVEVSGNVDARRRLGEQLHQRGDHAQAIEVYAAGLRGVFEHDPTLLSGLARAEFAAGDFAAARATLERLLENNPGPASPDIGLLYARALEEGGETSRALAQYAAVSPGYPGAEARLRHALLVRRLGDPATATLMLRELLRTAELAPAHYRRAQGEWLDRARRELDQA